MFKNIIGNEKNKEILKKSIEQNKISHSYIFWGTEGIGKKEIAKQFAKKILCLESNKQQCSCKSCIEFDSNNNPDFFLIEAEEGKIKIETIRQIQRKIAEKPIISNKKVYIIDDAEVMTTEAQNCLLKTLEEPPEYATIILVTSNENNLLSTIKSRCTRMHFEQIPKQEIKKYLEINGDLQINDKMLEIAEGSIGKVIKLRENIQIYNNIEEILLNLKNKDLIEIIQMSEEIYKSKEQVKYILEYMNSLVLDIGKRDIKYIKCIQIIEDTKKRLKANSNYDMCIDNMLFNIWEEVNEKNNRS